MVYVGSLRERMDRRGWNPNDRVYQQTQRAYDALHGLNMSLHYIGCGMIPSVPLATGRYIVARKNLQEYTANRLVRSTGSRLAWGQRLERKENA